MKYIVILGDGMADMPSDALGGMTPLEVAYKPNIDSLAQKAICGMCKTVPDGIKPGSDVANLSVMGYSPLKYYSGRSPLEALSIGVDMADSDLAVRCNLVTLSEEENYADKSMLDYSAGEISTEEAAELISFVQEALGDDEFAFYSGVSYRHCLIKHNGERGTEYTPPHDISGKVIGDYLPKGLYGDKMLDLMVKSYDILIDHPINLKRKRMAEGKDPANSIWLWGEGSKPTLPNFERLRGLKGAVISAVDLLKGIGIASGMEIIEVEGATGTVHTNFAGKAQACVQAIRDGFDYRLGALFGVGRFEYSASYKHAVRAELHHERGVRRRGDAPGRKVHHGEAAFRTDLQHQFERRAVFLGKGGDFLLGQGAEGADFTEHHAAMAHGFDHISGPGLAFGADHGRAFRNAAQGFTKVAGTADERHRKVTLVDMETVVGGSEHFALVDVVHAQRLKDAGFHDMADAGLGHDRDGHRVHNTQDNGRISHTRHAARLADVGGNALKGHDRTSPRLLRDFRLFGRRDVHDDAAFEHFGQTGLKLESSLLHDVSPSKAMVAIMMEATYQQRREEG